MRASIDQKQEAIGLLETMPAWAVIEQLGLTQSERTVQRWGRQVYGVRPTYRQMSRDRERQALVRRMEALGLNRRYCLLGHHVFHECLIRDLAGLGDVNDLAFVCWKHSQRGDR
jgi:hypothetical protein